MSKIQLALVTKKRLRGDFLHSDILKLNDVSIFTADIKENNSLAIGVPHHTPSGTYKMPCESHKYGDENTGYIGNYIAEMLNCSFLCACNYFIDPNKNHDYNYSDYYLALQRCRPRYLVEIHGHGPFNAGEYDIEISCGSKEEEIYAHNLRKEIQRLINNECLKNDSDGDLAELKKLRINSDFDNIYFKATKSSTITDKRWVSYHIELPLMLRISDKKEELPKIGEKFTNILCKAIANTCK